MNCLSWWLPLFILPLPICPPELFALFVITYTWKTKPCSYCAIVLIGLFFSTCYWTHLSPWKSTDDPSRIFTLAIPGFKTGVELDLGWSWRRGGG
ncbi:unnamed protein product [Sympodiomycopsis kandeliae]